MSSNDTFSHDSKIISQLQQDNEEAFEHLFNQYHVQLFRFALKYVRIQTVAEEIVHDVLLYIWEHRHDLKIIVSLKSYLYTAVKNRSLDYLKSQYARHIYESDMPELAATPPAETLQTQELKGVIQQAIERLPEKCRLIYSLSRTAGLTYREIAEQLEISPKTVEVQMGIALQKLRKYLRDNWEMSLWLPLLHLLA